MPLKKIDYLPFLESCWQEHLQPRPKNAPTVISLFAGCGGSSLGYSMAGFRELLAVEWDNNAVETFKLNFPDVPVYHGDIAKLSVKECLKMTGLKVGELDILDGSPPCQGFSTAGKRQLDDPRNQLFREYVRLLRGLKPKVFVMENVSGMVKGIMKFVFVEILKELKASGYKVSARLLNAMYFGVPQSRQRMIFIGVREDLGIESSHPEAESKPPTIKDAWGISGVGEIINNGYCAGKKIDFDKPSPLVMQKGMAGTWRESELIHATYNDLAGYIPAPQVTGKAAEIGFALKQGQRGSDITDGWQDTIRPSLAQPAPVVLKEAALWKKYPKMIHPIESRGISIGELKRIHSFPDAFKFTSSWVEAWARIGNSVPPLFMRSVANHIRQEILK